MRRLEGKLIEAENSRKLLVSELMTSTETHVNKVKEMDTKLKDLQGRNIVGYRDVECKVLVDYF